MIPYISWELASYISPRRLKLATVMRRKIPGNIKTYHIVVDIYGCPSYIIALPARYIDCCKTNPPS